MKNTVTIHTKSVNGGPFNCQPARTLEIEIGRVLCNDIVLPWESHAHNMRAWVIGNEFGACGVVWASHEQDAFDELCDAGLSGGLAIEEKDSDEETARLGNAGEPHDLTYAWIQEIAFDETRDVRLLCQFAEARGAGQTTLEK